MKERVVGTNVGRFSGLGQMLLAIFVKDRAKSRFLLRRWSMFSGLFRSVVWLLSVRRWLKQIIVLLLLLGSWLLFDRCGIEDFEKPISLEYDATWGIPVGHVSLVAQEVLSDHAESDLQIAQDSNRLLFTYFHWEENMVLHDRVSSTAPQRLAYDLEQPQTVPAPLDPPQRSERTEDLSFGLNFGDELERVDSLVYRSGGLRVMQSSGYSARVEAQVVFLNFRSAEGVPLRTEFLADYRGILPILDAKRYPLDNYRLHMPGGDGSLSAILQLGIEQRAGEVLRLGDELNYEFEFVDAEVGEFYGRLSTQPVPLGRREIPINGLDDVTGNVEVVFTDPRIVLSFDNQYGIPLEVRLKDMSLVRSDASMSKLRGEAAEDRFFVAAAEVPGQVTRTKKVLSIGNTNIGELFGQSHVGVSFDIEAVVNPPAPYPQEDQNFSFDDQSLHVSIALEIPYSVILKERSVTMQQFPNSYREDLDKQLKGQPAALKAFTLRLIFENSLPLRGEAAVMLIKTGEEMSSMFENEIKVQMPLMNNQGHVMQMRRQVYNLNVEGNVYERFMAADSILIETVLSSEQEETGAYKVSKLYSDYKLNVQLVAIANVKHEF